MTGSESILSGLVGALGTGEIRVIDLTQPLCPETPIISLPPEVGANSPPFEIHEVSKFDEKGQGWYWNWFTMGEHTGTHFDAPNHWITGRDYGDGGTDTIAPGKLVAPACVIDCSAETAANPDYLLTADGVRAWETKHGQIEAGSWVLMRTDWSKRTDPDEFINADDTGPHTPGPDLSCVTFLAEQRDVMGFGVETVGTDAGQAGMFDPPFPCHHTMHGANKLGLASLTNLDQLPPKGAVIITPPLKIVGGSGSPLRVLALVAS